MARKKRFAARKKWLWLAGSHISQPPDLCSAHRQYGILWLESWTFLSGVQKLVPKERRVFNPMAHFKFLFSFLKYFLCCLFALKDLQSNRMFFCGQLCKFPPQHWYFYWQFPQAICNLRVTITVFDLC